MTMNHTTKYKLHKAQWEIARFFRIRTLDIEIYFMRHKITRFFTILFLILSVVYIVQQHIYKSNTEKRSGDIAVSDFEEYAETLKEVPSDIQGMSQYDKYAMGLDYRDGSDTDKDGLTDQEEIEIYGTDPLQASTSGDLYTDGYKVQNGMTLTITYDYADDREFSLNECGEVALEALSATDFNATVEDCSNRYELDNWGIDTVYKGYFIYNFSGNMSIDVHEVLLENGLSMSEIDIWSYEGAFVTYGLSEMKECKYSEENEVVTLKQEFDADSTYYIFITSKKTLLNSLINTNKTTATQLGTTSNVHYLMMGTFFKPSIYYPEMDSEADEKAFMKAMNEKYDLTNISYIQSSEEKIQMMYKMYSSVLPFLEFDFENDSKASTIKEIITTLPRCILAYQLCNYYTGTSIAAGTTGSNSEDSVSYHYNNYHTSFDPNVDELPFQNFASKYTTGNCAGISYFTCALANTGSFPSSGSYGDIEWDLTGDPDNSTLMDAGLSDYKSKTFVDDKGDKNNYLGDGLTVGEREFVNMIGAYWTQTNETFDLNEYRIENKNGLSWDVAEVMMDRIDQGKTITVSFLLTDNTGHEVVLYDYYWIDDEELIFRVYDPNIPMNHSDGYTLNCDGACYLQCKKINNGDGTYNFIYLYYPIEGAVDYCATSDVSMNHYSAIIVSDETWTIYNEK